MQNNTSISILGIQGCCGHLDVFMGFAAGNVLYSISFADVLDESSGSGYQRPRNVAHSRSFSRYISQPNASTIPLTFNLRRQQADNWSISSVSEGSESPYAVLTVNPDSKPLAQVDCQHRLGELEDCSIPLAFMSFIGLDLREEMALFTVINSRAKGLSSSLTDYHESNLLNDLAKEAPHLYIARRLNEDADSPWFRLIRYGGENTSGLKRRTSLRMIQQTIQRFLKSAEDIQIGDIHDKYQLIVDYWKAIKMVFPSAWDQHRHNLLTKGVGLYSLMYLLHDIVRDHEGLSLDTNRLVEVLMPLQSSVDWSSSGMFANAGGQKGALEVYRVLKDVVMQ